MQPKYLIIGIFCWLFNPLNAQNSVQNIDEIINDIFEQYTAESEESIDYESFYSDLVSLAEYPLNLNNTTKEELDRIKKVKGDISPDNVLEEARNKNNPIHDNFEWDNKIAGDKFRKQQVRQLLGDFVQVTEEVRTRK
ncbi:MAG: hypothetical protein ACOYM7_01330, partial [Paludibacter sp.]